MLSVLTAIWTVFLHSFHRRVTVQYPDERRTLAPRSRGRVILTRDPDGTERCTACNRCVVACPTGCIAIQGAKREDGSRYPASFKIDFARCISCGYCEEICPTSAIQLVPELDLAEFKRPDMTYEKGDLLVNGQGKYQGIKLG